MEYADMAELHKVWVFLALLCVLTEAYFALIKSAV